MSLSSSLLMTAKFVEAALDLGTQIWISHLPSTSWVAMMIFLTLWASVCTYKVESGTPTLEFILFFLMRDLFSPIKAFSE